MRSRKVTISIGGQSSRYDIKVGAGVDEVGRWAKSCLKAGSAKILIVSNPTVNQIYGDAVRSSLEKVGFRVGVFAMGDGERFKTWNTAQKALSAAFEFEIGRSDAIVALGGGVVGDLAGFVSSILMRGISVLQVPTTLLSMIDSSVGGKTGVNSSFGKNLIGAFHQPSGVLIDIDTLATLPPRELTAGFCEIIKQAAIGGQAMMTEVGQLLTQARGYEVGKALGDGKVRAKLADLIAGQVAFKARVVAGDERESVSRKDARSRKILNFGHTLAHALEKVTSYRRFKHGEAVGYGIMFAAELSKKLALIDEKSVILLNDVVHRAGDLPRLTGIEQQEVLEAFRFDKKNLAGSLQFILLKGIGKPVIVTDREIPLDAIELTLSELFSKWA